MASPRFVVLAAACALVASGAAAQTPDTLTPVQIAVACAPPPVLATVPAEASRVIGSQDPVKRSLFGTPEVLVIGGGMNHGLSLGQEYFIRRVVKGAETYRDNLPHQVHTIGWVRVVAVNETTTIVSVDHACADILVGDFLEAFQMPTLPDGDVTAVDTTREPDFTSFGRVLYGADEKVLGGLNSFYLLVDEPEVYGLPRAPKMPSRNLLPSSLFSAAGAIVLALLGIVGLRKRRMDEQGARREGTDV